MGDARSALIQWSQSVSRGERLGTDKQSVGELLTRWMDDIAPAQLRPRTVERYEGIVRLHLIPLIGRVPLGSLSPQHIDALHASCAERMSPSSVRYVHAVLRSALRYALQRRLILINPADAAPPPRGRRREMLALSRGECRVLLDAAAGDELEALYVLAVTTGMRLGELLGLRWVDVDLGDRGQGVPRVSVRRQLSRTRGTWILAEPKTTRATRSIRLSARAAKALRAHRVRQNLQRLEAGAAWGDHDLVFTDVWGEPLYGAHVTERKLKPLLKGVGLPPIRFHDLRHSAATLLLAQGVNPKIVSEMLGHASIELTLDTYSHVLPDMQGVVPAAMDEVLG